MCLGKIVRAAGPGVLAMYLWFGSDIVALGQARPTAERTTGISGFAGFSGVSTDYGVRDYGFSAGVDFTRYLRRFQPSLELRTTYGFSNAVGQHTFDGGLKVAKPFGRVTPYGDLLVGAGFITFPNNPPVYNHDNSIVYMAGGGADLDVLGAFGLKADFQAQSWKLGAASNRLTPYVATIGITYHLSARAFRSER